MAKPAIHTKQTPIPEETLLNLFPKRHQQFLKYKESLEIHVLNCRNNYNRTKAFTQDELPEEAKFNLLRLQKDHYRSSKLDLQHCIEEYYYESAQLIKHDENKAKRRSERAAAMSKVHQDDPLTPSSPTRLKYSTKSANASTLEPTEMSRIRVVPTATPSHAVDVETKLSSHSLLMKIQPKSCCSNSEHHTIMREGVEPSLDVTKSRLNICNNSSQETSSCDADVDTDSQSYSTLTRVHTENDGPELEHQLLTQDDSSSFHHAETESTKTHQNGKAEGTIALKFSRARLSKDDEAVSEPFRPESKNTPSTLHAHISDDDMRPCVWKMPDEQIGRLHRSDRVNSNVDSLSIEKHSHSKFEAQTVPPHHMRSSGKLPLTELQLPCEQRVRKPPDKEFGRLRRSKAVNSEVDSQSVEKHSPLIPEAQRMPLRPTRSLQELLESYQELEWRAHNKSSTPCARKPPDKGFNQSRSVCNVIRNADNSSVMEHSPSECKAQPVPIRHTRSLEKLQSSYPELPSRALRQSQLPFVRRARKPPDKYAGREFLLGTLKRAKGGLRSVSKLLWPAFNSVRCRQARIAPCLESNG
jgi:hypothetical protein